MGKFSISSKKNADWLLKNAVNGGRSTEEYRTAEFEKRAQEYRATEITFTQKIKRNGSKENFFVSPSGLSSGLFSTGFENH